MEVLGEGQSVKLIKDLIILFLIYCPMIPKNFKPFDKPEEISQRKNVKKLSFKVFNWI